MNKTSRILLIIVVVLVAVLTALLLALMPGKTSIQTPDETIATDATVENVVDATEKEAVVLETEPEATEIEPEATETEPEATEEEIIETEPEVDAPKAGSITYEEYLALEVEVQQAYYEKFETPDAFFEWLNEAEKVYESEKEAAEETEPEDSDIVLEEGEVEEWEEEWE